MIARALRAFAICVVPDVLLLVVTTLSWLPGQAYGGQAATTPLPVQQVIAFAPLTSTPFYAALGGSEERYGCTTPAEWRKVHRDSLPVTMIVQLAAGDGSPTWRLVAKPWSFRDVGDYVRLLCPELKARMR